MPCFTRKIDTKPCEALKPWAESGIGYDLATDSISALSPSYSGGTLHQEKSLVWKELSQETLEQTRQEFSSSGKDLQQYAMASEVILHALGPGWWKSNCLHDSDRPDNFFRSSSNPEIEIEECRQLRVIQLGHCLYALKKRPGYSSFLEVLRTRDLEPAFFELWAASTLQDSGFEVEFVLASGRSGEDYDLVAYRDGFRICVEAKTRYPDSPLNENTITNTLNKARKQLPQQGPNVVMVSIPSEWAWSSDVEAVIGECVSRFFRNSRRVNRVVFFWEHWVQVAEGRGVAKFVREYENPAPNAPMQVGPIVAGIDDPHLKLSFWW